jgi:hypothetical protein
VSEAVTPRQRAEAAKLIDDLARRGIRLYLRNGSVRWTATDEAPTAADQWAVFRMAAALKTILTEGDEP